MPFFALNFVRIGIYENIFVYMYGWIKLFANLWLQSDAAFLHTMIKVGMASFGKPALNPSCRVVVLVNSCSRIAMLQN